MPATAESPFISVDECARMLGVTPSRLKQWRYRRTGPPYIKLPRISVIMYNRAKVEEFIRQSVIETVDAATDDASKVA